MASIKFQLFLWCRWFSCYMAIFSGIHDVLLLWVVQIIKLWLENSVEECTWRREDVIKITLYAIFSFFSDHQIKFFSWHRYGSGYICSSTEVDRWSDCCGRAMSMIEQVTFSVCASKPSSSRLQVTSILLLKGLWKGCNTHRF